MLRVLLAPKGMALLGDPKVLPQWCCGVATGGSGLGGQGIKGSVPRLQRAAAPSPPAPTILPHAGVSEPVLGPKRTFLGCPKRAQVWCST